MIGGTMTHEELVELARNKIAALRSERDVSWRHGDIVGVEKFDAQIAVAETELEAMIANR